jgi:3-phenylpropionate/trans-cinnamate dioxygenase ferredoxin reductase component
MADAGGAHVRYLRTLDDSTRLRESLQAGRRLAIIGGGWIGLEVAAAARTAGCEVTVLESLDLPLLRVLGPEVAERFAALHRGHGVDLRTGVSITGIHADGTTAVLRLDAGEPVGSDLLVVGIGVAPRTALAEAAGLDVDNGIVVDEHLRTSDPAILAAGDVANAYHPRLGRHLRVEHWDNAIAQGQAAARTMLGGGTPYERLPYFFTDQYDLGMEYVGSVGPDGFDDVVLRGDPASGTFAAFWLAGGRILAGMHVNDWDAIDPIRALVGESVDAGKLADPGIALTELAGTT